MVGRRDPGGIAWLVDQVTGDLADAITRDLISDRLNFSDIQPSDMRAYIESAQPGTAIFHAQNEAWGLPEHILAELLFEIRKLNWRYSAVHFENGTNVPYPERITRPGVEEPAQYTGPTWETATAEELIPPEVRELMRGA